MQDLLEVAMVRKRLIIEMGMGIDQHGQCDSLLVKSR
jgi:hypothetical protein